MNSTQRMVIDALQLGAMRAVDVLGALRLQGRQLTIEGLYVELVAMEAREHVRVEGLYDGAGNRVGGVWALGSQEAPQAPGFAPEQRVMSDALRILARPIDDNQPTPPGVTVHRCL